jgi:hypothetical protein
MTGHSREMVGAGTHAENVRKGTMDFMKMFASIDYAREYTHPNSI